MRKCRPSCATLNPSIGKLASRPFAGAGPIAELGWPSDVVKQWLFDHGRHPAFLRDYATIDLSRVRWRLEVVTSN